MQIISFYDKTGCHDNPVSHGVNYSIWIYKILMPQCQCIYRWIDILINYHR